MEGVPAGEATAPHLNRGLSRERRIVPRAQSSETHIPEVPRPPHQTWDVGGKQVPEASRRFLLGGGRSSTRHDEVLPPTGCPERGNAEQTHEERVPNAGNLPRQLGRGECVRGNGHLHATDEEPRTHGSGGIPRDGHEGRSASPRHRSVAVGRGGTQCRPGTTDIRAPGDPAARKRGGESLDESLGTPQRGPEGGWQRKRKEGRGKGQGEALGGGQASSSNSGSCPLLEPAVKCTSACPIYDCTRPPQPRIPPLPPRARTNKRGLLVGELSVLGSRLWEKLQQIKDAVHSSIPITGRDLFPLPLPDCQEQKWGSWCHAGVHALNVMTVGSPESPMGLDHLDKGNCCLNLSPCCLGMRTCSIA